MTTRISKIKCPECGSILPVEEERTHLFCAYCGVKIIITSKFKFFNKDLFKLTVEKRIIPVPEIQKYRKKDIDDVKAIFQAAGFKNIETISINDIRNSWTKKYRVESISINGKKYEECASAPRDAKIVIHFHYLDQNWLEDEMR